MLLNIPQRVASKHTTTFFKAGIDCEIGHFCFDQLKQCERGCTVDPILKQSKFEHSLTVCQNMQNVAVFLVFLKTAVWFEEMVGVCNHVSCKADFGYFMGLKYSNNQHIRAGKQKVPLSRKFFIVCSVWYDLPPIPRISPFPPFNFPFSLKFLKKGNINRTAFANLQMQTSDLNTARFNFILVFYTTQVLA